MAKTRFQLKVYRWTFMTNHIHLLIEQTLPVGVSEAMHFIQGRYAKYFGRRHSWKGHVWESRYTNRLILDDKYFQHCAWYIENNPVKAGLVSKADEYRWSSAAYYSLGHQDPLTDLDPYSDNNSKVTPIDQQSRDKLFIARRAVGRAEKLRELSEKLGQKLLVRSRRSLYPE